MKKKCNKKEKKCMKILRIQIILLPLHPQISKTVDELSAKSATSVNPVFFYWRDGRVVECTGLENRRTERYRGFESLSLRKCSDTCERLH